MPVTPISEKTAMKIFAVSRTAYSVVVVNGASKTGCLIWTAMNSKPAGDGGEAGRSGEGGGGDRHVRLLWLVSAALRCGLTSKYERRG